MTIFQYIKTERQAGRFPNMLIDNLCGVYWLCDNNWQLIDDPKNWFYSEETAQAYKTKMLDKKVKYIY